LIVSFRTSKLRKNYQHARIRLLSQARFEFRRVSRQSGSYPVVGEPIAAIACTILQRGKLNVQFSWSRPVVKEGTRSVDQGTPRNYCGACSIWQCVWKGNQHQKALRLSSGEDRGCPKSALGKSAGKQRAGKRCSDSSEAYALGGRTKEDRRCTKGPLGESESWKENGLAGQSLNESLLEPRGSLLLKQ
jgi:hypothetical protein